MFNKCPVYCSIDGNDIVSNICNVHMDITDNCSDCSTICASGNDTPSNMENVNTVIVQNEIGNHDSSQNGSHGGIHVYTDLKMLKAQYPKNIICSHLNVNGLRSKVDEIKYILQNGYVDILCLSECKLDTADNISMFNPRQIGSDLIFDIRSEATLNT